MGHVEAVCRRDNTVSFGAVEGSRHRDARGPCTVSNDVRKSTLASSCFTHLASYKLREKGIKIKMHDILKKKTLDFFLLKENHLQTLSRNSHIVVEEDELGLCITTTCAMHQWGRSFEHTTSSGDDDTSIAVAWLLLKKGRS